MSIQRSSDIIQELATLLKQQVGTLQPTISGDPRALSMREVDEYFRRSERIQKLEHELSLALEEEQRKIV